MYDTATMNKCMTQLLGAGTTCRPDLYEPEADIHSLRSLDRVHRSDTLG